MESEESEYRPNKASFPDLNLSMCAISKADVGNFHLRCKVVDYTQPMKNDVFCIVSHAGLMNSISGTPTFPKSKSKVKVKVMI